MTDILLYSRFAKAWYFVNILSSSSVFFYADYKQAFAVFLQSVFYIGKGTQSRPFAHFKEAIQCRHLQSFNQCQVIKGR